MSIKYTQIVQNLPSSVPFVGPEAQERVLGKSFGARIGANESVFGPSPKAILAMKNEIGEAWKYGDPESFDLKHALAKKHNVEFKNIIVGEGIDGLLGYLVRLFVEQGDNVVTTDGAYPTFNYHVEGFGGQLHKVSFKDDTEDLDNLLTKVKETKAKMLYVSNPNNPMGTLNSVNNISNLIENLPAETLLCLDEAYIDFVPLKLIPKISVNKPNVIRLRTFSKAYGMAGARVGYGIAAKDLILNFEKVRNHFGMSRSSQVGALESIYDNKYITDVISKVEASKSRIANIALANNCKVINSFTNFIAIDCCKNAEYSKKVLESLIRQGVFVRMPYSFPQNRCIRVTAGLDKDIDLFETAFPIALMESK
ncbi:pyridoxal phosphate-dependent aminotransferase [Pseudomonadota bacterium]|nr:pyridoxal phosphate-dependent aminotransferase [Pseudomonadota bacterium]